MSNLGTGTLSSHLQGALAVGIRASKAVVRTRVLRDCDLLLNCHKSLRFACASNENWGALALSRAGYATTQLFMPAGLEQDGS